MCSIHKHMLSDASRSAAGNADFSAPIHFNLVHMRKYLWCAAFLLQFLLFRSYCYREILTCIPEKMDQVGYANVSYKIYDMVLQEGLLQGFIFGLHNSVNSGMTLVGAANLFLFGFTRFSLLLPNFFACFLCQYIVASVLERTVKNRLAPFIFCGLFLMTKAVFAAVGGIFDYRWDYMTFCVYTVWLACLLEHIYTDSRGAFYRSAAAGGVLLFIRLNTIFYLAGTLFIIGMGKMAGKSGTTPAEIKKCLKQYAGYAGVVFLTGGWYLAVNFPRFFNYYFSAIFTGSAKEAWKVHMSLADNILFYPRLLFTSLMGPLLLFVLLVLLIAAAVSLVLSGREEIRKRKPVLLTILLSWLVPYGILTVLDNKNSAAAMVLIGPLLLLPLFAMGKSPWPDKTFPMAAAGAALAILAVGTGHYVSYMVREYPYHTREEAQEYVRANEIIARYMKEQDMDTAEIIFDRLHETFFPTTIEVYSREQLGRNITVSHAIPAMKNDYLMTAFDKDGIRTGLGHADFVVINREAYADSTNFISDAILSENKTLLADYAAGNMCLIGEVSWGGAMLEIYARPVFQIQLQTQYNDWLGPDNTDIAIWDADGMTALVLEGNLLEEQYGVGYENQTVQAYDQQGRPLYAEFALSDSHTQYKITVGIESLDPQYDKIHLEFEDFFIPDKVMGNGDSRRLTVGYPAKIYMETGNY